MERFDRALLSFVPRWMAAQLAGRRGADGPAVLATQCALLFADISGFTQLSLSLAERHGAAGADRLQEVLNRCFGALVARVTAHGGEVVRFAGDGLLAHWPAEGDATDALAQATARAEACAHALSLAVSTLSSGDLPVKIHVAVCAGPVEYCLLGGHRDRWECVLLGDVMRQIGPTLERAGSGQVALSAEALDASRRTARRSLPPAVPLVDEFVTEEEFAAAEALIPQEVRSRVRQGLDQWLAELRTLTVLFLSVPSADREAATSLHRAVARVQLEAERHYGFLKEVSVDDKGLVAIVVFGLGAAGAGWRPGYAVACALRILSSLHDLGLAAHAGVATDRLFCGTVGGDARREYTTVGRAMILAARLCFLHDGVLCDEPTALAARGVVALQGPAGRALKGFEGAVPAWTALRIQRGASTRAEGLVGRAAELAALTAALDAAAAGGRATVVLEGAPGIGKSQLLDAVVASARERGMPTFVATGDALGMTAPYDAFRPVAEQVFELPDDLPADERRRRVEARLAGTARGPLAALLNPLLGTDLPDSPATEGMRDFVRATATRELFLECFREACGEGAALLVVEDGHWLDGASVDLLEGLRERMLRGAVVFATRPLPDDAPKGVRALVEDVRTVRLRVGPLSPAEAEELIASRLRVAAVPAEIVAWIHQRAAGHPFFCAELASALAASGLLLARDGVLVETPTREALDAFTAPATVEGTILHRIDQLGDRVQWTLKSASVLGMAFDAARVAALHPLHLARGAVGATLDQLVEADLCDPAEAGYTFRHRITLEVAYRTLVSAQRQRLHRAAAESMERGHAAGLLLRTAFPEIAHHWLQTDAPERALPYLEGAWEDADRDGAMLEAFGFMAQALAVDESRRAAGHAGVDALRRATWHRRVAEAAVALGRHAAMHDAGVAALPLLGEVPARTSRGWKLALLGEVATQVSHRLLPARAYEVADARRPVAREAARVWTRLAEAKYYLGKDIGEMIYAAFRAINLAERGHGGAVVTTAYGQVGLLVAALGLDRQARYYLDTARRNALETGLPRELSGAWLTQVVVNATAGRWADALARIDEEALPQLHESRSHLIGPMLSLAGSVDLYAGHLAAARRRGEQLVSLNQRTHNAVHAGWGYYLKALVDLAEGRFGDALDRARRAVAILDGKDRSVIMAQGARTVALARLGAREESLREAEALLATLATTPLNNFHRLDAFGAPAEVFLLALARGWPGDRAARLALAGKAVAQLERFARSSAAGVPRSKHFRALLREAQGRGGVRAALEDARDEARRRAMPWEEARVSLDLARRGALDPAVARGLFAAVGCGDYGDLAAEA